MDLSVTMGGVHSAHIIIGVGVELSPLHPSGPRSGVPDIAVTPPAPSLGPALCPEQAIPQGHFLSPELPACQLGSIPQHHLLHPGSGERPRSDSMHGRRAGAAG